MKPTFSIFSAVPGYLTWILYIIAGSLVISIPVRAQEQSIQDYLDAYIGENAQPYIQPLADIFTSNMNTNVWEWSGFESDFYVRLKVQGMITFPTEDSRTFTGKTTGDFQPPKTVTAPTIIGDRRSIILFGEDDTYFIFPGGYDLKQLMLGTPQLTVGGFLHSEISTRFLSFTLENDIGGVRVLGVGARHAITGHFPNSPVDLAVGYFYHHVKVGTYLDSDQHLLTAHIGKSGKWLSGHVMVGYQTSGSDVHYTHEEDGETYDVDLFFKNQNNWIVEASTGIKLGPAFATGAISYSRHITLAVGVGLFF